MNVRNSFLVFSFLCCLTIIGCGPKAANTSIPAGSFRASTEQIIKRDDNYVMLKLSIETPTETNISTESEGSYSSSRMSSSKDGKTSAGYVILSATKIAPNDKTAYIQILVRPHSANGGYAGGASIHTVPPDAKLEDFVSFVELDGIHKLDTPITIGTIKGKLLTLTVGKPPR
jgi:hypothetical protein